MGASNNANGEKDFTVSTRFCVNSLRIFRHRSSCKRKKLFAWLAVSSLASCLVSTRNVRVTVWKMGKCLPPLYLCDEEPACVMPNLPVMPPYLKRHWHPVPVSMGYCGHIQPVIDDSNFSEVSRILPDAQGPCCVQEVTRGINDSDYNLSGCTELESGSYLPQDMEGMFVTCNESRNALANLPLRKVRRKLEYWQSSGVPVEKRPISIFLFGVDTVSRSHAHRSLPRSMAAMKQMDFVDFSGYHSVSMYTVPNFMGFLMGMTQPRVRDTCAKNWSTPFDNCPFIWNRFSASNYVTGFFEDGLGSLNWGGQSGFVKSPTDYYLRPLFLALSDQSHRNFKKLKQSSRWCYSRLTIPEFMIHHSQKFVQTFHEVPFFSFFWWAYPFHDNFYALASFDDQILKLLEFFEKTKVYERTMVIFIGDHGDRFSQKGDKTAETFMERGLPPLFIRMPEKLKASHPEMYDILKRNAAQLTTPFDVHHTMLHVLSLSSNHSFTPNKEQKKSDTRREQEFQSTRNDRSSLLVKVPQHRTCESTNIPSGICMCNLDYTQRNDIEFRNLTQEVEKKFGPVALQFAIDKLNQEIKCSKYKDVCHEWWARSNDTLYTRVLRQSKSSFETVFAFRARPGYAGFEVRMKIEPKENRYTYIGFHRITPYGGDSWCVGTDSDNDKQMKEMCKCKEERPM